VCVCVLYSFIYETEHHNGIAELLEILGRYKSSAVTFSKTALVVSELNESRVLFSCVC